MSGESSKRPWDHKGSERIIQSGQLGGDNETTRSGSNHNVGCQKTFVENNVLCFASRRTNSGQVSAATWFPGLTGLISLACNEG